MRSRPSLAFKLALTGLALLLTALASIALTLWVTWQLEGGAAAVNEAGRMRMMSYRLALDVAAAPSEAARAATQAHVRTMDETLERLRTGDPSRPLFIPWDDEAREDFNAVRAHWLALRERLSRPQAADAGEIAGFVAVIDRFVSVIEQRLSHWTAVLRGFQFAMLALAIGAAMLMFYVVHVMVLEPLRQLGAGLERVRAGDFSARVALRSSDEFGQLSAGFNTMAEHLQTVYRDLEAKVEEKTAHLERERGRLAALYEISAFVARAETLDELAQGFAAKLRRVVAADAVAIRWSDESNARYLMLAQDGLPTALVDDEQCLPSGGCHCGRPADMPGARMIPIHADPRTATRCHAAGFALLVAVPVMLHQRVLGEINLFYREDAERGGDERALVEALASHLAGGMESLRAAAADKEAAVSEERALIARELHDSIAQSLAFLKIQVELLRDAEGKGQFGAVRRAIDEIGTGVRECYGDVRELLLHFRTRADAEDIETALRVTLQKFEQQTGLSTRLVVEGHGVALPADVRIQVLHVVQEALSNVRKHAQAAQISVTVQPFPHWRFEVADDGCGFDARRDAGENHVGLRIMRERAQRIGARADVFSRPGHGTRVVLTVPRETAATASPEMQEANA